MNILSIRKKASKAGTAAEMLEAVADAERGIREADASLLDIAARRAALLPVGTSQEVQALDAEAATTRLAIEQARANLVLMKTKAAEMKLAERLAKAGAALERHNSLIPGYLAKVQELAAIGQELLALRSDYEQEGRNIPGFPALPAWPIHTFNLAALGSVRPAVQPASELYAWEKGSFDAANSFSRHRKAARRAA